MQVLVKQRDGRLGFYDATLPVLVSITEVDI